MKLSLEEVQEIIKEIENIKKIDKDRYDKIMEVLQQTHLEVNNQI